jgi:hypothetical protein
MNSRRAAVQNRQAQVPIEADSAEPPAIQGPRSDGSPLKVTAELFLHLTTSCPAWQTRAQTSQYKSSDFPQVRQFHISCVTFVFPIRIAVQSAACGPLHRTGRFPQSCKSTAWSL